MPHQADQTSAQMPHSLDQSIVRDRTTHEWGENLSCSEIMKAIHFHAPAFHRNTLPGSYMAVNLSQRDTKTVLYRLHFAADAQPGQAPPFGLGNIAATGHQIVPSGEDDTAHNPHPRKKLTHTWSRPRRRVPWGGSTATGSVAVFMRWPAPADCRSPGRFCRLSSSSGITSHRRRSRPAWPARWRGWPYANSRHRIG
jgi:hypothetical protein